MTDQPANRPGKPRNPRFFERDATGSVRLRIRLSEEDANLIEEAAGDTPLVAWIQHTLANTARRRVTNLRKDWPTQPPANGTGRMSGGTE